MRIKEFFRFAGSYFYLISFWGAIICSLLLLLGKATYESPKLHGTLTSNALFNHIFNTSSCAIRAPLPLRELLLLYEDASNIEEWIFRVEIQLPRHYVDQKYKELFTSDRRARRYDLDLRPQRSKHYGQNFTMVQRDIRGATESLSGYNGLMSMIAGWKKWSEGMEDELTILVQSMQKYELWEKGKGRSWDWQQTKSKEQPLHEWLRKRYFNFLERAREHMAPLLHHLRNGSEIIEAFGNTLPEIEEVLDISYRLYGSYSRERKTSRQLSIWALIYRRITGYRPPPSKPSEGLETPELTYLGNVRRNVHRTLLLLKEVQHNLRECAEVMEERELRRLRGLRQQITNVSTQIDGIRDLKARVSVEQQILVQECDWCRKWLKGKRLELYAGSLRC